MTTARETRPQFEESVHGELLTPGAAAYLFGITESAVRAARLRGDVRSPVVMGITGKDIHLLDARSALAYWGGSRPPDMAEFDRMRRNGTTMTVEDDTYHVLHTRPVLAPAV